MLPLEPDCDYATREYMYNHVRQNDFDRECVAGRSGGVAGRNGVNDVDKVELLGLHWDSPGRGTVRSDTVRSRVNVRYALESDGSRRSRLVAEIPTLI